MLSSQPLGSVFVPLAILDDIRSKSYHSIACLIYFALETLERVVKFLHIWIHIVLVVSDVYATWHKGC